MSQKPQTNLSRVDKLRVDRDQLSPEESRVGRAAGVPGIVVGEDAATSEYLQIALLTAVNLARKSFNAPVPVQAPKCVWEAICLTALGGQERLGAALLEIGAFEASIRETALCLLIGNGPLVPRSLRLTFDGWLIGVGPSSSMPRMQERPFCTLAAIAAAAIGVGEAFSHWAGINVAATRQDIKLSLWRPDLSADDPKSIGNTVQECPESLELFGLGHLGQAYLWAIASLPFEDRSKVRLYLCDDDEVELPNLETGALLTPSDIGKRKSRALSQWLEKRKFVTKLIERFIDEKYRRCSAEPVIALSGFDNNEARQFLSSAGFDLLIDSGLGGEATNFDSVSVRAWPQDKDASTLWPLEDDLAREKREAKQRERIASNSAYEDLAPDECGRLLVTGKAVAVPFVGAIASVLVLAEVLRACNGVATFNDLRVRVCSMTDRPLPVSPSNSEAPPVRGLKLVELRKST
ncbi:MAG: ThiF family adenylyltransferase [Burkholderiales bacterium]|nr:ThiF family adenylyltransferase [Burkholderiales bacterium]